MLQIRNLATVTQPENSLDAATIDFGKTFTPNLFRMEYRDGAWRDPRIEGFRKFELHPAAIVFHYAQTIFEGLKAFRQNSGRIVLFRPEMNARRFNRSAARLAMPEVDEEFFVEAVRQLVTNERYHVPDRPGSLYIRPTMIGTEPTIGVKTANEYIFFILSLPTGSYFREARRGPGLINVLVSESVVRACPGGAGNVKAGGNYAVTLGITGAAAKLGCSQVLFLDSAGQRRIEEMGGMNIFFVRDGALVTPPLCDTILAGITRDTILSLARELGIPASEEALYIDQVVEEIRGGRITEALACGTAAIVTGIGALQFESGESVRIGHDEPGPVSSRLYDRIVGIHYGDCPEEHGWIREVCAAP